MTYDYGGELFTLTSLKTISGGSIAVLLIVQLVKDLPFVNIIPSKILSIIIAEIMMVLTANPFPKHLNDWVVILLNGLLLASTSIGGLHLIGGNQTNQSSYKL